MIFIIIFTLIYAHSFFNFFFFLIFLVFLISVGEKIKFFFYIGRERVIIKSIDKPFRRYL